MATAVVLVNGLPGSGKTTLATALTRALRAESPAELLSKDAVKEALADRLYRPEVVGSLGAVAMETVWALAVAAPSLVVLDSWWFRPRDLEHARAGLARLGAVPAVELWCEAPDAVARERYARRVRHAVHADADRLDDWDRWVERAAPLALTPVVRVDTGGVVDPVALVGSVLRLLGAPR